MSTAFRVLAGGVRRAVPHWPTAIVLTVLAAAALWLRLELTGRVEAGEAAKAFVAARAEAGVRFRWEQAMHLGLYWSAPVVVGVCVAALATMRWWCRPQETGDGPGPVRWSRGYAAGMALVAVGFVAVRLPLASGSLWWDEVWNVKYATVGEWRKGRSHPGEVRFYPSSWPRAAWYYNKPANHPVVTLPSRAAHLLWQRLTGAPDGTFSERVLRLPVMLAGLGAMLLAASAARSLGGDPAGLFTALILAIHPWVIRYGVDARAYGMSLLFAAAGIVSLLRIAGSGAAGARMRWWWLLAGAQFGLMWAHVVANLPVCLGLFGAALLTLFRTAPPGSRGHLVTRLVVMNVVAAGALLLAFLPNLLQAATWHERNDDGNRLTAAYIHRTISQMLAGMEPAGTSADLPGLSMRVGIPLAIAGAGLCAAGVLTVRRRRAVSLFALLAIPAGSLAFLGVVKATDFYFYHRFLIPVVVPLAVLAGIGLSRLPPVAGAVALAAWTMAAFPQVRLLASRSYAPLREVAAAMRQAAGSATDRPPILLGYGLGGNMVQAYEPSVVSILDRPREELQRWIETAQREGRPLVVAWGYDDLNRVNLPDGFALLDQESMFEPAGEFRGIEPEFTFRIVRLREGVDP